MFIRSSMRIPSVFALAFHAYSMLVFAGEPLSGSVRLHLGQQTEPQAQTSPRALASVRPIFESAQSEEPAVSEDATGFSYSVIDRRGKLGICNGVWVGKHEVAPNRCDAVFLTAQHCLKDLSGPSTSTGKFFPRSLLPRNLPLFQTNADQTSFLNRVLPNRKKGEDYIYISGDRNRGFGMSQIKEIRLGETAFVPLRAERPKPDVEAALVTLRVACDSLPDEKVYEISAEQLEEGDFATTRKSAMWRNMQNSHGYGRNTPLIANKQLVGKLVTDDTPYYHAVKLDGRESIESGDSGSPIFRGNKVIGVISGGTTGGPAFNKFIFASESVMGWAKDVLTERYGTPRLTRRENPGTQTAYNP